MKIQEITPINEFFPGFHQNWIKVNTLDNKNDYVEKRGF
jgi:hypothetical protein